MSDRLSEMREEGDRELRAALDHEADPEWVQLHAVTAIACFLAAIEIRLGQIANRPDRP